jgi:DNA-binding transcriptional MerR regulator/methylmalonyl-CoA mutase cobalamin-binding subunit
MSAMQSTSLKNEETSHALFPIRTVSELTGVNAITLRAWENRYGLIEPVRKSSGHRLYTQEHIDLINRVVGLLDRGMRIGQVTAELLSESAETSESGEEIQDHWKRYINGMIAAIIRFDEDGLERIYGEALSHYPVRIVTEKLLTPLLAELGNRWYTGRGSVAEEHFFGFYLRNKLGARFHHRSRNQVGPKLMLACLPKDMHEIGLLLFALEACDRGFQIISLGANMPLGELPAAIEKTGSDALVLSGVIEPEKAVFETQLPQLIEAVSVPVFLGGKITAKNFDSLRKTGLHLIGTDIETGLKQISAALGYRQ